MFENILFDLTTGKYLSTSTYIQSFVGRVDDVFNSIVEEHRWHSMFLHIWNDKQRHCSRQLSKQFVGVEFVMLRKLYP